MRLGMPGFYALLVLWAWLLAVMFGWPGLMQAGYMADQFLAAAPAWIAVPLCLAVCRRVNVVLLAAGTCLFVLGWQRVLVFGWDARIYINDMSYDLLWVALVGPALLVLYDLARLSAAFWPHNLRSET